MKHNIILMGPPGSGKGTQAKNLAQHLGYFYFGTGDLMREEAKNGTEYGRIFQKIWDQGKGELVPDEIVEKFVEQKFSQIDFNDGVVFDGYPRTLKQAEQLQRKFKEKNQDFVVIDIEVSHQSLIERMATRKVCENCGQIFFQADQNGIKDCNRCHGEIYRRQEDEPAVVQKRLDVYDCQTKPLIDYFARIGKLINIDGELSIGQVEKNILAKLHED